MSTETVPSEGMTAPRKRNGKPRVETAVLETGREMDTHTLLSVLTAAREGDFSARLPIEWTGVFGRIADAFNDIIAANETMTTELERVSRLVGKEGRIQKRANFKSLGGAWRCMEESINTLITDLVWPTTEVTRTLSAIAKVDL